MLGRAVPILMVLSGVCLLLMSLSGCARPPVIVEADTSCDRFAHISFNDAQRAAVAANWDLWESAAEQVAAHNVEYDKRCL